jgi:hypothetical protein
MKKTLQISSDGMTGSPGDNEVAVGVHIRSRLTPVPQPAETGNPELRSLRHCERVKATGKDAY